jgi:hypothetical protein
LRLDVFHGQHLQLTVGCATGAARYGIGAFAGIRRPPNSGHTEKGIVMEIHHQSDLVRSDIELDVTVEELDDTMHGSLSTAGSFSTAASFVGSTFSSAGSFSTASS